MRRKNCKFGDSKKNSFPLHKNHDPRKEVVIFVDVDQRRFSSTAEGKVNRHLILFTSLT